MPSDDLLFDIAEVFKVFGDTTRMKIISALLEAELCVGDISEITNSTQSAISHQLRVGWSGDVYISTITGEEEIEDVKFRWESWDAGNGYAGPRAASDHEYIKQSVKSLKQCWEDGVRGYCDYYAII